MTNIKEKIIVTGGSGYIGSLIIQQLLEKNKYNIVAIVRDENKLDKYEFLTKLKNAKDSLTFAYGDLDTADYLNIFQDSSIIIHAASPYIYSAEDPQRDIVQPAIRGNIRVLDAASKIKTIRKVIIISSTVAIVDLSKGKEVYNEDDWNDGASINTPYPYSKYLAEKAAWEFSEKNGKQHFQLTFINPSLVFGPSIDSKNINTSIGLFLKSIIGDETEQNLQRTVGIIDIRDVSKVVLKVVESNEDFDHQRYSMATAVLTFQQITKIAQDLFPQYKINQVVTKTPLNYKIESKSKVKLDSLIDIQTSIKDTIDWLIQIGKFKPELK